MYSRIRNSWLLGMAAIVAIGSVVTTTIVRSASACIISVARFVEKVFFGPLPLVANEPDRPAVVLGKAKQFLQRQIRRERVLFSPSWRMCPSV